MIITCAHNVYAQQSLKNCEIEFPLENKKRVYPSYIWQDKTLKNVSLKRGDAFIKKVSPSNIDIHLFCKSYLLSNVSKSIYAVAFNSHTKTPDWVAYRLNAERTKLYNANTQLNVQRAGSEFYMDDELKSLGIKQAIPMTYNYNNEMLNPPSTTKLKYQKGHLIPAGDCKYTPEALDSSFSYINAAPQHATLNSGKWNALERAIHDTAKNLFKEESIYIISGVYGKSRTNQNPVDNDKSKIGPYKDYQATIPACFYKIIYDPKNRESIAFLMPNINTSDLSMNDINQTQLEKKSKDMKSWKKYVITVQDLENRMALLSQQDDQLKYNVSFPFTNKGIPSNNELLNTHFDMNNNSNVWYERDINNKLIIKKNLIGSNSGFPGC